MEGGRRSSVAASWRRDVPWRRWRRSWLGGIPSLEDGVDVGCDVDVQLLLSRESGRIA